MTTTFPPGTKPEDTRAIDVEIDIDASVDEVWPYLSTSEGLSSWYVSVTLGGKSVGDTATLDFGGGMVVPAQVVRFVAKDRIAIGAAPELNMPRVEEYRVAPKAGGGCTVRIVNWGFGEGADWEAEYQAVKKGWLAFLQVLKRVVEGFRKFGPAAQVQLLSMGADTDAAWATLRAALGASAAKTGGRVEVAKPAPLAATVVDLGERSLALSAADEAGGMLVHAMVESHSGMAMINVVFRLFGARAKERERIDAAWGAWFREAFPMPETPPAAG